VGRLLRIQDRILLLLADIGDLLEELHDPGGWFKNYYETLYGWVPYRYKRSNYKVTFKRMLKIGNIEKIVKNGETYLRLTSQGKQKLVRDFPLVLLKGKKWKGTGTLVVFDIEETQKTERNKLRRWLLSLGAGKVQRSVYLSSYDIVYEVIEAVRNFGLENQVEVFPVDLRFIKNKKKFAYKVWQLGKLEKEYQLILNDIFTLKEQRMQGEEKAIRKIRKQFLEVLLVDPCLPKEFLPTDWIGERVRKLVKSLVIRNTTR
jgi:CRISPR-associated endonuclease Cas2